MSKQLQIIPLEHIGEVMPQANLADLIFSALQKQSLTLEENDIIVVTQKIVSKAEGRVVTLDDIHPSDFAIKFAKDNNKDASHIELILQETKRIVRMDHGVIISETHHGFICANAGVDESNVGNKRTATVLPKDPDASAKKIYEDVVNAAKIPSLGVIISDTWGRPWREGQVNFAIGVYGFSPVIDYRGQKDTYGFTLQASVIAIADELAGTAELVMGKTAGVPAVLIRGYHFTPTQDTGKKLLRDAAIDMFR